MTTDPCAEALFVFDKDGVLVDSEPIKLALFERMFDDVDPARMQAIRSFNRSNVGLARKDKLRHILGEILRVESLEEQIDDYLDRSYHFIREALVRAPAVPGVVEFIMESPNRKFVCSAAIAPEVDDQLVSLSLTDAFEGVYAFPHKKAEVLRRLKEEHRRPVVFWGDTTLDLHAARQAGVTFIGVQKAGQQTFANHPRVATIADFRDVGALRRLIGEAVL